MVHQSATVGMTRIKGHFFALITILIWSSTFIVSKILLNQLTPIQILITRFLIAIIFLSILSPKFVKPVSLKEEALFLAVGTLTVTAVALTQLLLTKVIGPLAVLLGMFLMVVLGVPASNLGFSIHQMPGFFGWLHGVLPLPAAGA